MAAQRQGFASHLNRQAKAKKIQPILEQALGRSLDGLRVLDVGTGRDTLAHRDGWTAPRRLDKPKAHPAIASPASTATSAHAAVGGEAHASVQHFKGEKAGPHPAGRTSRAAAHPANPLAPRQDQAQP